MDSIAQKAQATAWAASNSQAELMQMATAMRQLAVATTSISYKFEEQITSIALQS